MSISTYTELASAVGDWLDRDDLTTRVPSFIQLVEGKLNRRLQDPEQETTTTITATDDYTSLPADFGEVVSISTGEGPLQAMGPAEYAGIDETFVGTPRFYTIVDGSLALYPRNSSTSFRMVYRKRIPPLTSGSPTNWLLSLAPDVYLYGVLVEASAFLVEDERAAGWKALFEEAVTDLMADGARRRWGAGPIAPRIRRT